MKKYGLTSKLLHWDRLSADPRMGTPENGALHRPIHANIAFGYDRAEELAEVFQGKRPGFAYGRQSNPTVEALQNKLTLLEGGVGSVCFSTGMAAIGALAQSLLINGDHMVSSQYLFGNTNSQFETFRRLGIEVDLVDATRVEAVAEKINEKTKLVFVETIANPMTQISDLKAIGDLCAEKGILFVVDNTMTTPILFSPHAVNAGLVVHSLSKYICGHGNALGGVLIDTGLFDWKNFSNILEVYKKGDATGWGLLQIKKKSLRDFGATLSAEVAHAISIGSDTLKLRMRQACENARALTQLLNTHPQVEKVYYPGLETHSQHHRAKELFSDFGALFSFVPKAPLDCFKVLNRMDLVVSSSNLGDNRTLAIPVAHTIFYEMGPEKRKTMGIPENAIRVSVGIEETQDLLECFNEGLKL